MVSHKHGTGILVQTNKIKNPLTKKKKENQTEREEKAEYEQIKEKKKMVCARSKTIATEVGGLCERWKATNRKQISSNTYNIIGNKYHITVFSKFIAKK